ncbi:MAG TPA: hypothetical protein VG711_05610 [Phycisphaerales bacterium]|nr:hypothetical protein [Phycisphaerales bacterium]
MTPSNSSRSLHASQPSQSTPPPRKRDRSPMYLIVTSSLTAVFVCLAFIAISIAAHKDPSTFRKLPSLAQVLLENPWSAFPLSMPSILLAIFALRPRYRVILLTLSSLFLLVPFALVLYTFISLLTPLYQYQPL